MRRRFMVAGGAVSILIGKLFRLAEERAVLRRVVTLGAHATRVDGNLGAPVPVVAGIAIGPVSGLPGPHALSAVFTPSNPTRFQPSTSNTVTVKF
jgi:hypothetical protein